jgi:hypothetical protein
MTSEAVSVFADPLLHVTHFTHVTYVTCYMCYMLHILHMLQFGLKIFGQILVTL